MAHGDYACCALCDSKMYYDAFSEEVKTQLDAECAVLLSTVTGRPITTGSDLAEWIRDTEAPRVQAVLSAAGFSRCFYPNEVDTAATEKLGEAAFNGPRGRVHPPTFGEGEG